MNAAIKRSNRPNRAQPAQHERPAYWPRGQVYRMCEDELPIIPSVSGPDWQGNDGRCNEDKVHDYEDCLELSHDFRHDRSKNAVTENTGEKGSVYGPIRGCPIPIASDHDNGKKHQGEAVIYRAKPSDETQGIAISNQKAQRITSRRR